jgi:hypothetical protein
VAFGVYLGLVNIIGTIKTAGTELAIGDERLELRMSYRRGHGDVFLFPPTIAGALADPADNIEMLHGFKMEC